MGRSQNHFMKLQREKKRLKKKQDKAEKKQERRENSPGGGLDNMMAYVDEFGNITDTPPGEKPAKKEKDEDTPDEEKS